METNRFGGMIYGGGFNGPSCQIQVTSGGLDIFVEDAMAQRIGWAAVRIEASGTDDQYLKFASTVAGSDVSVLTGNRAIVDAIRTTGAPMPVLTRLEELTSVRKRRAMGRRTILLGLAAVVTLAVAGAYWAIKPVASKVTDYLPPEWEQQLGRSEAQNLLESNQTCTDEELNSAISEIGRRLVMGMGQTPYQWQIKVIDVPDVNAFALPGGYVFINRGLIEAASSPEEVAGVLAHEFQHVLKRHGMKNVVANLGIRLVLMAMVGDMDAVQGYLLQNMGMLAAMEFSRSQESEADMGAVELSYNAHINPDGFLQFMKKLEEQEGSTGAVLSIVSTHPGSAERMDDIRERIAQKGQGTVEPFVSNWASVKKKCAPSAVHTPDSMTF